MDKWQQFLITEKKKTPSRKSGAGLERSLKWFLDTGPQKKGGYPKKRRPNFRGKKFNDISAPPGAPGGLEEDSDARPGYRKRIDRYTKDRDSMLKVGGQKNTPPFTQKMGSHVTFDRQLEEEVEEEELSSLSLSEQESNRPKANAKTVGKKSNFSFFIEPQYALGT